MNYRNLEKAIKFAMAPLKGIQSFTKKANSGGTDDSWDDRVLADYLGEHEDPREVIIRRDLAYRGDDYFENLRKHQESLTGVKERHPEDFKFKQILLPDGTSIESYRTREGKPFRLNWDTETEDSSGPNYFAAVTPEEHDEILEKLGVK